MFGEAMIPLFNHSFTRSSHALDAFCSSGPSPTAIERFESPRCRNRRCTTLGRSIGVHLFVTNDDQPAQLSALFDGQYVIIGLTGAITPYLGQLVYLRQIRRL